MINSSLSYRIRPFSFAIAIAALIFFFVIISINLYVNKFRHLTEAVLSQGIGSNVAIAHLGYAFPNYIVADKIRVFKRYDQTQRVAIFIRKAVLPLNLKKSFETKKPVVEKVYIDGADIFYSEAIALLKENGKKITGFFNSLPRPERFKIESNSVLILPPKVDAMTKVHIFNTFEMNHNKVFDFGTFKVERFFLAKSAQHLTRESAPFAYNCELFCAKDDIEIEKIEVKSRDVYSKLWGNYRGDILGLNGFLYTGHYFYEAPGLRYQENKFDPVSDLARKNSSAKVIGSSPLDLNIFDIACTVKFAYPKIYIQPLSFSLGNVPLAIKGEFALFDPAGVDLLLTSFPEKTAGRDIDRRCFDVAAHGWLRQGVYNGKIILDYTRKLPQGAIPGSATLDFKNLGLNCTYDDHLDVHADKISFSQATKAYARDLEFSAFKAIFDLKDPQVKNVSVTSRLYDGSANAQGRLNLKGPRPVLSFDTVVRSVTAAKLDSLVKQFDDIEGKLNSRFSWRWDDLSTLKGRLAVKGGKLNDYDFFLWLAKTFALPELCHVDFDFLSMVFFIDDKALKLENINLKAKRIAARGYYGVNDGMVSSKISLSIPRDVLAKSEKFKPLVKLVGRNMPIFDFDFQLSGASEAMNFKWLDSEFKDKLKKAIPGFVERGIEHQVETILDKNIIDSKTGS